MKYIVEILRDGRVWAQTDVDAKNRRQAAAYLLLRAVDGFAEAEDFDFDRDFPADPDEVMDSHELTIRVHRMELNDDERQMLHLVANDPRSPFAGMVAMPEED